MSGLGGSRPKTPAGRHLAEQHLGDRLSALVDGELGHDARERVLAHVATCSKCKAEVDAQRRLKSVFSEVAPPAPSESFLARLQGLPGGGVGPLGSGALGGERSPRPGSRRFGDSEPFGSGPVFGGRAGEAFEFGYLAGEEREAVGDVSVRAFREPSAAFSASASASASVAVAGKGFPVHPVGRHEERSRGMRFAFVAAGAVSLAAIALGGVTGSAPIDQSTEARGGAGSNVTPSRAPGAAVPDSLRRRAAGPLLSQGGQGVLRDTPTAPTEVSAPLLPGIPTPVSARHEEALRALTAPVVAGAAAMSPLIRPLSVTWPTTPGLPSPDTR
ncbi:anti-sigma factor family protein [Streptomyces sp. S6]